MKGFLFSRRKSVWVLFSSFFFFSGWLFFRGRGHRHGFSLLPWENLVRKAPCALGRCPAEATDEGQPWGAGSLPAAPSPALPGTRGVSPAFGAVWEQGTLDRGW